VIEQWLRADGDARNADDASLRREARCDSAGCVVVAADGRRIAFVQDTVAFEEDCRRANVIVTRLQAPPTCHGAFVLDGEALKKRGATTLRFSPDVIEVTSVRKGREVMTWPGGRSIQTETVPTQGRPRPARPVPEQDLPEDEVSTGEPD
jgi:competence protein ComEC